MIKLEKFTTSDFDTLISWVKSDEELKQFAGPIFSFPLTTEQLNNYINMSDKEPFKIVLDKTGKTIGHCELNHEDGINRLSRILIGDKNERGKGYGRISVSLMAGLLFENPDIEEVDLNVFDWNISAIKCYEKIGFKIDTTNSKELAVGDKLWTILNMKLHRDHWKVSAIKIS